MNIQARKKLGDKPATTVHIFERNDFFYLFEKDGEMAADYIYGSVTATKTMGKLDSTSFCVLNHANFEKILRFILLVKHLRLEIFKFVPAKVINRSLLSHCVINPFLYFFKMRTSTFLFVLWYALKVIRARNFSRPLRINRINISTCPHPLRTFT